MISAKLLIQYRTLDHAVLFTREMVDLCGIGYHPDTSAEEYVDPKRGEPGHADQLFPDGGWEQPEVNRALDVLFEVCKEHGTDPAELGLAEFRRRGFYEQFEREVLGV